MDRPKKKNELEVYRFTSKHVFGSISIHIHEFKSFKEVYVYKLFVQS